MWCRASTLVRKMLPSDDTYGRRGSVQRIHSLADGDEEWRPLAPAPCSGAAESAMVLIQLLLPTTGAASSDGLALTETRRELAEQFTGVTAYLRSPAKGLWTAPDGHTEQDDIVMVEVVTQSFDRVWWQTYAATLAHRFRQERIHIRAIPVQMPHEGNV